MFSDRKEASGTSALRRFLPIAMPRRSDAVLFFEIDVDAEPLAAFIADHPDLTPFHVVLAAALRTLVERPQLNRTVLGGRIIARDRLALTFSVKRGKRDGARLVSTKVVFEPTDSLFDVQRRVLEAVERSRSDTLTPAERRLARAERFPRTLVKAAYRVLQRAEASGLLPDSWSEDDPSYTSAFIANLGSIGLDASFHHLSDIGTASLHATVGRIEPRVVVGEDGNPTVRRSLRLRFAIDDRIVDGFYCAKSLVRLQHWLEHPQALARPWPTRTDIPVAWLWKRALDTPEAPAYWLRSSTEDDWFPTTWSAMLVEVRTVASALVHQGVEPGDVVAIQSSTRPEWTLVYLAAQAIGAIPAGLHEDLGLSELRSCLELTRPRLVVLESDGIAGLVAETVPSTIVTMEREHPRLLDWTRLLEIGARHDTGEVEQRLAAIDENAPAAAVFTSGSTGNPRAALLSHANFRWTAATAAGLLGVKTEDRSICYLPLSHVAEQAFSIHGPLITGASVAYAPSRAGVVDTLREVRPTVFFGVPVIWRRLLREIDTGLEDAGLDRVRVAVSGAGALPETVYEAFRGVGLSLLQTYGQTEGCGPTTFTAPGDSRPGTCGPVLPGVEVRLEDRQVFVRGPNVFLGYLDESEPAVDDAGWLASGDLGSWEGTHLRLTGRRKSVLVPLTGENVAPEPIESALEAEPLIDRAIVLGNDRPHLVALLTLDLDAAVELLATHGIGPTQNLAQHGLIQERLRAFVGRYNDGVPRSCRVHAWTVLPGAFTPEAGELTPTLKLRRNAIEARWSGVVDALYSGAPVPGLERLAPADGFHAHAAGLDRWGELFGLRHAVFDEAGHLAGPFPDGQLRDRFDDEAIQFALTDPDGRLAGTARLVPASGPLPVETLFDFDGVDVPRESLGEIGRLAIDSRWRRRRAPVVTLISGLLQEARHRGLTHVYAFVPARSVRLYSALGLPLWVLPQRPPGPTHQAARARMAPYFEDQDPQVIVFTDPGGC